MPRFFLILITFFLVANYSFAQPVSKEVDSSGHVFYKSSDSVKHSAALPEIKKENLEEKISEIKKNIPLTCSQHQGIDCEKGADADDQSVICVDDFRDSKESFKEFCSQTRLQLLSESFLDEHDQEIPKELRKPKKYGGKVPVKIVVKLRNLSGVPAKNVVVQAEIVKRSFDGTGPSEISPFALEEYVVNINEARLPLFSDFRTRYRTVINCDNCLSSRRTPQ